MKRRSIATLTTIAAAALCLTAPTASAQDYTGFLGDLIGEMMNPEGLARISKTTRYGLITSADPKGEGGPYDRYVSVDETGQAVLADLKGPGCVRRIFFAWKHPQTADSRSRRLIIDVDGAARSRVETTLQSFLTDLIDYRGDGKGVGQPLDMVSGRAGGGTCCYLPIPYEKSLKITLDAAGLKGLAYQIGYHTYEQVPSNLQAFRKLRLYKALEHSELLGRVNRPDVTPADGIRLREHDLDETDLPPGQSVEQTVSGAGFIRELSIRWARADRDAQRGLVFRAYWDGEAHASIEVPVDDLFGFDHGNRAQLTTYLVDRRDGKEGDRLGRLWLPMPFGKGARLVLTNENNSGRAIPVSLAVRHRPVREMEPSVGRLHARWSRHFGNAAVDGRHHVADIRAAGRLIGCLLAVGSSDTERAYLDRAEALSVDGAAVQGTSMEHFFNGAHRYRSGGFSAAYHGVPIQRWGSVTQMRFFIPDSIPFQEHLALSFPCRGEDMASVVFWYQCEPHKPHPALPPAERRAMTVAASEKK